MTRIGTGANPALAPLDSKRSVGAAVVTNNHVMPDSYVFPLAPGQPPSFTLTCPHEHLNRLWLYPNHIVAILQAQGCMKRALMRTTMRRLGPTASS